MSDKSQLRELAKTVYDSIKSVKGLTPFSCHPQFLYCTIDEQKFNSLTEYYKLYLLKKHVNRIGTLTYENKDFLYNTFKQHPNILIELLEYLIIRNNNGLFAEIFAKHKRDIIIYKDEYKKLLDISFRFIPSGSENMTSSFHYSTIILDHEVEYMLFNNDEEDEEEEDEEDEEDEEEEDEEEEDEEDDEVIEKELKAELKTELIEDKEKELELKNYQILLLQKDKDIEILKKEIEQIKVEKEQLRQFYINS